MEGGQEHGLRGGVARAELGDLLLDVRRQRRGLDLIRSNGSLTLMSLPPWLGSCPAGSPCRVSAPDFRFPHHGYDAETEKE